MEQVIERIKALSKFIKVNISNISVDNNDFVFFDHSGSIQLPPELVIEDNKLKTKEFCLCDKLILINNIKSLFSSSDIEKDTVFFTSIGTFIYYSKSTKEFFSDTELDNNEERKIKNTYAYYNLYNFLKSSSFSNHYNDADKEIIFYSSTKGIYKVHYDKYCPDFLCLYIQDNVSNLLKLLEQNQHKIYFINSLFSFQEGVLEIDLKDLIINSSRFIDYTIRDFELVLKQFDFDKFRDSLYKEKDKYFNNIREIVNKIFSQAIGIPISISASIYATYKIGDDSLMLLLVMLAFITYTVFYIKIQFFYKSDIIELKGDFANDFEIIKTKSGLTPSLIEKEKVKIENKISKSLTLLNWLIGIVTGLGLLVCLYIIYQVSKSETICLIKLILKLF